MTSATLVFLGIIAFCALVQAVFFAALAVGSWKAAGRVDGLADRAQSELARLAPQAAALAARIEELSRQARDTVTRAEPMVQSVADQTERASRVIRRTAEMPFVPAKKGAALLHGVLQALATYRQARRTPGNPAAH